MQSGCNLPNQGEHAILRHMMLVSVWNESQSSRLRALLFVVRVLNARPPQAPWRSTSV